MEREVTMTPPQMNILDHLKKKKKKDEYLRDYAQVINMRSKEGDCSRPLQE